MWERSKQKGWVRLLKQINESEMEFREYGVEEIRWKSHHDTLFNAKCWDRQPRTVEKSWKNHRNTQYKTKKDKAMSDEYFNYSVQRANQIIDHINELLDYVEKACEKSSTDVVQ